MSAAGCQILPPTPKTKMIDRAGIFTDLEMN